MCLVEDSTYSIQCSYIAGSNNTSRCSYVLVSVVEDTRDISGTTDGNSTANKDIPNIKDYGRILIYYDNILALNKTLDLEKIEYCPIGTQVN